MESFVSAQRQAIHQGLRLLELVATSPLGLYTDVKALREALHVGQEQPPIDRMAFRGVTENPIGLALKTLGQVSQAIDVLADLEGISPPPLEGQWLQRARKVIQRAEDKLGGDLRRQRASNVKGLYVIVDPQVTNGRPVLQVAEAALKGGARVIQFRDKLEEKGDALPTARSLLGLCQQFDALFIANDHADLAVAADAHGLHLGQHDLPLSEARAVLAPSQLIGRSNALVGEAMESQAQGADYIAVGSIFSTTTKEATRPAGLEVLRRVKESVTLPVVAIGGINQENVQQVLGAGADAVCVISAVTLADDPQEAASRLVEKIEAGSG